jgi:IS1 family transposase
MVSTRLWLGGVVSLTRDRSLADRLLTQVRSCCQLLRALLVCTDGWNVYPVSIRRPFREKVKETAGRGRACLRVWPQVCIAVVIKRTQKKRVVEITRKMAQGTLEQAQVLLSASQGGTLLNTAFIERLNGTIRHRLANAEASVERDQAGKPVSSSKVAFHRPQPPGGLTVEPTTHDRGPIEKGRRSW